MQKGQNFKDGTQAASRETKSYSCICADTGSGRQNPDTMEYEHNELTVFSVINVHMNHLGILFQMQILLHYVWGKVYISNKLPGDGHAVGSWTLYFEGRKHSQNE